MELGVRQQYRGLASDRGGVMSSSAPELLRIVRIDATSPDPPSGRAHRSPQTPDSRGRRDHARPETPLF